MSEDSELDPEVLADPLADAAEPEIIEVVPEEGSKAVGTFDPFRAYMAEIKKYPTLSREEEHAAR